MDSKPKMLIDGSVAVPVQGQCALPNGCTLYWQPNRVGGRSYYSDEVGGGVDVWNTALVASSTLLAAMTKEAELSYAEYINKERSF